MCKVIKFLFNENKNVILTIMKKIKVLSLFTGAGGLDIGFDETGLFEIIAANDNWDESFNTMQKNFPDNIMFLLESS